VTDGKHPFLCGLLSIPELSTLLSVTETFDADLIIPMLSEFLISSQNLFSNDNRCVFSSDLNERQTVECEKVSKLNLMRVASAAPLCPSFGFELYNSHANR